MKSPILWILALYVLVSFIITTHSAQVVADVGNSGFISIDCGASKDYVDEETGIWYETDEGFIETGTNHEVSPSFAISNFPYLQRQLNTLRSFPQGKRNCYTLKPKQEDDENHKYRYIIRVMFAYQNYDYKNDIPKFDLYLGVSFWQTVRLPSTNSFHYYELTIPQLTNGMVQVCLVETGEGIPFINTLELRPLNNSLYSSPFPLSPQRTDCGYGPAIDRFRYEDDVYDRLWPRYDYKDPIWDVLRTTGAQVRIENSTYKLPSEVLLTACQPQNNSNLLTANWSFNVARQYYLYLHFAEIQKLPSGKKRIINVTFDDENSPSQELALEYLKPVTLISNLISSRSYVSFTVRATVDSYAPPILNAFEILNVFPLPNSPTDARDVNAIMRIKLTYGISKISWQGDPCVPSAFAWEGVNCSSGNNTRIVSLNVTGNKLTGPIPTALKENAKLNISAANNPGLCERDSCDQEKKFVIPLTTSIGVLVLIAILSSMIWRLRRDTRQDLSTESPKMEILKQKNREFSYSQVLDITDNLKTLIGEGGFGKVYLGTLEDGSQVAVKLLSPSSKQGYKEFQSEAQLLAVIHHRNLVSLVGYCYENNIKALIYEYVDNGDLRQLLEKNSNVLKWNQRLQVAIDTAKGLEYLHTGCHTPIIHRDLKPSNILLNKFMVAKIADFGLSRAFTNEGDSYLSTQPAGTLGYIDPEFQRSGQLNKESDIYSFGMILLQLITGRPPIKRSGPRTNTFILDWIQPKIECGDIQGIVDPRLAREFYVTSTSKAIEVAMSCVLPTPSQRPEISYILQELQECLALEMDHTRIDNTI
ncbi:putative leucine-rich repeat receptor-like serine/threonine-protein kinase At2g19230 isoform X2 [Prosopis cineraria]|uniref:putative leucine-rich repeat receptor-like serine/threonine-protein kinase At2g19230 isoform X2 n=1 Tax=Prosopis cineraria TaxID=364024 RepID=UPI00240ECC43|nr:putative leucine-rich repeat receptor-like serine/threonine-protein kinase At2g19230 isoform X2 [Prosopis cineraria]